MTPSIHPLSLYIYVFFLLYIYILLYILYYVYIIYILYIYIYTYYIIYIILYIYYIICILYTYCIYIYYIIYMYPLFLTFLDAYNLQFKTSGSSRAWAIGFFVPQNGGDLFRSFSDRVKTTGFPTIFWYTLGYEIPENPNEMSPGCI